MITSYEGVRFAQKHPDLFSSAKAFDGIVNAIQMIPIAIDPPKHADYRRVLDPMFGPKRMEAMDADLRAQLRGAHRCVRPARALRRRRGPVLQVPHPGDPDPVRLPLEHLPKFLEWVTGIIKGADIASLGQDQPPHVIECSIGLFGFLAEQLEIKRSHPGDDMLSNILALDGDEAWTDAEILGLCFLIILAGLDTVTGAIGFSLLTLANDPALRHRLIDDQSLIAPFIEEMLRLEGPVPGVPRVTTADVEVEGVHIPANSQVMLMLFTANREGPRTRTRDGPDRQAHPPRFRRRHPPVPRLASGPPGAAADHRGIPRPHPGLPAGRRGHRAVARRHLRSGVAPAGVRPLLS